MSRLAGPLLLVLALTLAACGGSGRTTSQPPTTPPDLATLDVVRTGGIAGSAWGRALRAMGDDPWWAQAHTRWMASSDVDAGPRPGLDESALRDLRGALRGEVLTNADEGYQTHRRVWNGSIDRRPELRREWNEPCPLHDAEAINRPEPDRFSVDAMRFYR